ncbi:MAG TPA: hypothetical protein VGP72_29075 [Planctomycetota bacterium]
MRRIELLGAVAWMLLVGAVAVRAEEAQKLFGTLTGKVIASGGTLLTFDGEGKTVWSHPGGNCSDIWMLPSGNVLFANGEVNEVDPKTKKVVFNYKSSVPAGGGAYSCQRLENGNTLVGENSTGKILEVSAEGKTVFELQLPLTKVGEHHNLRMVRKLKNGNYLACHSGKHIVREYTPKGEVVFEVTVGNIAFSGVRLPNGNTMVGHIDAVTEFDPQGKTVWEFKKTDLPDVAIGMICGVHVQPSGNVLMGIYQIQKVPNGAGALEITREKKLVWRYIDAAKNANGAMMGVQLLDAEGKALPGDVLR